jgi:hypothetical protein
MNNNLLLEDLRKKEDNAVTLAGEVAGDTSLLAVILDGISSREANVKYRCIKVLTIISENTPEALYPQFSLFDRLLDSDNNILKWNAIDIIANLTAVDSDHKFEAIYDRYYGLMNEGSMITAAHVVESSGKIVKAKPALRKRITEELLKTESIPLPTEECRNIVKGKAIETFGRYFSRAENEEKIVAFVRNQATNSRNATRKKAELFLKRVAHS